LLLHLWGVGGGSPGIETITLNLETDYEAKKNIAKYLAGIIRELDQSKELRAKPAPLGLYGE
jgi:hypothetical protein